MTVDENQLASWAKAPSETEEVKCQHTVERITNAIRSKFGYDVSIFLQGSYKNRTNVRLDSDVDIAVRHDGYCFSKDNFLSDQEKKAFWANFKSSDYTFSQFKDEIQECLEEKFSDGEVERKNKCVKVWKNSQRVNADVVPCFILERMKDAKTIGEAGIALIADSGGCISSFPEQHYDNGVGKNDSTNKKYKSLVRIIKNVRNQLVDDEMIKEEEIPSFYLECLVWNISDSHFMKDSLWVSTRAVIATIYNDMMDLQKARNYAEVSDLKWLFRWKPKISPEQAKIFMQKAWDFIGYED